MNDKGVCRTAPTTPCLLIMGEIVVGSWTMHFFNTNWFVTVKIENNDNKKITLLESCDQDNFCVAYVLIIIILKLWG